MGRCWQEGWEDMDKLGRSSSGNTPAQRMPQGPSMPEASLCMLPGGERKFRRSPAPCPPPGTPQCWQTHRM